MGGKGGECHPLTIRCTPEFKVFFNTNTYDLLKKGGHGPQITFHIFRPFNLAPYLIRIAALGWGLGQASQARVYLAG